MLGMDSPVRVSALLETGALGWRGKLLIAVWRGTSYEGADTFYREMKAGILRYGSGVAHLAVIEQGSSLPSSDSRARIASIFDEYPQSVSCVSVVFEGTGFFAAAVGSVATGIMFLSGRRMPFKVHNSVPEAAVFLGRHMHVRVPIAETRDAVETLRRRLYGRPSFLPDRDPEAPVLPTSRPPRPGSLPGAGDSNSSS